MSKSCTSFSHAINGLISVYKPKGWTSRKATDFVQYALSNELWAQRNKNVIDPKPLKRKDRVKIGHGGTLDPMAEGVLVLGLGKGCRDLFGQLKGTKEYLVTAKFGQATDTYDAEGQVIKTLPTSHITQDLIMKTLPNFRGHITQIPPMYSALKVQGRRLYDYARNGDALPEPIKARTVVIDQLELVRFNEQECSCVLQVSCGGGTYMRSLVHDMAILMDSCGHMTALKRTRQGLFDVNDCLELNNDTFHVNKVLQSLKKVD